MRVLIAGVSTRAAAASAAKAGFAVTAIDAFGDLDHDPSVSILSFPRHVGEPFSARAAARAASAIACDAVVYLSNFENHPSAVEALAAGRVLWGNPPEVLRRVRDPVLLADALRARGFATPDVRTEARSSRRGARYLVKPRASGGAFPSTTRSGSRPSPWRTVRAGSSARTVPAPTNTASLSARSRWASARAASPVIQRLVPSVAAVRPSRLAASLSTT